MLNDIPPQIVADLQSALTVGRTTSCANRIGSTHTAAIGYVTIDVVRNRGAASPTDAGYFSTEILYDNVLIGDYQQLDRSNNFARSSTLVHIRAIPEGGLSGSATTNFRRTFYSRLQNGGTIDRRQPLPSTFVARWISGGDGSFGTTFNLWREGSSATARCSVTANAEIRHTDIVRFDEDENPTGFRPEPCGPCPLPPLPSPAVWRIGAEGEHVPPNPNGGVAGWMYFNLDNSYHRTTDAIALQNWIVVSMNAEGRYSVDFDAASLGNGCSPAAPWTEENGVAPVIGPAPNVNP